MPSRYIELQRCRDSESVDDVTRVLDAEGITYRLGADAPRADLTLLVGSNEPQVIVSVLEDEYDAARAAMEADSLRTALPPDHHLLTSTDEEILNIVARPEEWSPYDVAHARRIMNERGLVPARIETVRKGLLQEIHTGKRAPTSLILAGWVFSLLGGLFGFAIGCSLHYSTEDTPEGKFPTYDARSRRMGKGMLYLSSIVTILILVGRCSG